MSFTVKVIFLGLIGFVPSPEGGEDVAALLVDPVRAQPGGATCHAARHLPVAVLLHGKCDRNRGKCYRGFGGDLDDIKVPELLWLLQEEDLDISGDDDEPLKIRKPLVQLQNTAPRRARQSAYFSWVPSIDQLTGGKGQISEGCRLGNGACPLYARFQIQGGEASTCHMFHGKLDGSPGPEREVKIFDFDIPGRLRPLHRAIADAEQVVFYEPEDWVVLSSKALPDGESTGTEMAYLSPDGQEPLTLIIANISLSPNLEPVHPHSDTFFHLLADRRVSPPRRVEVDTRPVHPGPCEEEFSHLDSLVPPGVRSKLKEDISPWDSFASERSSQDFAFSIIIRILEAIHVATACDGVRFPKPGP